jgi:hypothetical protein
LCVFGFKVRKMTRGKEKVYTVTALVRRRCNGGYSVGFALNYA